MNSPDVIDLGREETAKLLSLNPLGQVPVLELDDGSVITESLTICQYLDAISGSPFLFGESLEERTRIGMWERRAEALLFNSSIDLMHHTHPMFTGKPERFPEWAKSLIPRAHQLLAVMAAQLEKMPFLTGNRFTAADVTAYLGYFGFLVFGGMKPGVDRALDAWADRCAERESMGALKQIAVMLQKPVPEPGKP